MASLKPKLVTIFGATGAQGGSVLKAMQNDPAYKLRAVTRNTQSDKAKAIAQQGESTEMNMEGIA